MKKCGLYDSDTISLYYDGKLLPDAQRAFSEHLLTCNECAQALLDLERDLFLMHNLKHERVPEKKAKKGFVFELIGDSIRLITGLYEGSSVKQLGLIPVRGEAGGKAYRIERKDISVEIWNDGDGLFSLEVSGIYGKSFSLYCGRRLVEAKANVQESKVIVYKLQKGSYSLRIDNRIVFDFEVR